MRYVPNRQAPEVAEVHYVDEEDSLLGGSPREIWGVRGAGRPTRRPGMPRQVGMTVLIKAIDRFEVSREVQFTGFAGIDAGDPLALLRRFVRHFRR
jgi:hypothetical protein